MLISTLLEWKGDEPWSAKREVMKDWMAVECQTLKGVRDLGDWCFSTNKPWSGLDQPEPIISFQVPSLALQLVKHGDLSLPVLPFFP